MFRDVHFQVLRSAFRFGPNGNVFSHSFTSLRVLFPFDDKLVFLVGNGAHVLGAVLRAKARLFSGFSLFDTERAAELAAGEDGTAFQRFRLSVRSHETERGVGCISYTKQAANPVIASDCRVMPE